MPVPKTEKPDTDTVLRQIAEAIARAMARKDHAEESKAKPNKGG
jgi:hypothetical protein